MLPVRVGEPHPRLGCCKDIFWVDSQSPSRGSEVVNPEAPLETRMNENAYTANFDLLNRTPREFEKYVAAISNVLDTLHQVNPNNGLLPDENTTDIIITSWLLTDPQQWHSTLAAATNQRHLFFQPPSKFWKTIARLLATPHVKETCPELFPDIGWEKYSPHIIDTPTPQTITPKPAPRVRPSPTHRREETITQFITRHILSTNYLQVFIFISRHTTNRHSSRGRKIYPYGQKHVAHELQISLLTVNRIFSWLRRHHIIFRRSNENPKQHKCATWFVCTSWKQSTYFLDPQHRRPKKGSPGSPRKRPIPRAKP